MPWHVRPILLLALLLACTPATLRADRLADLDSPDYVVRVAATESLLTDDSLTPEQVRGWLNSDLTLEQRHRLMSVARHVVLRDFVAEHNSAEEQTPIRLGFELDPRPALIVDPDGKIAHRDQTPQTLQTPITNRAAAMPRLDGARMTVEIELPDGQRQFLIRRAGELDMPGVDSSIVGLSQAVLVVRTLPGMPAHGRLRAGDLIVAVNGQAVHPQLTRGVSFADFVATLPPGEPVDVEVLRDGHPTHLTVPTTNHHALTFLYENQPAAFTTPAASAWQHFLDSVAVTPSE